MSDIFFVRRNQFSVGGVLAESWRVARRNIGAILLIGIVVQALRILIDPAATTISPLSFHLKVQSMGDGVRAIIHLFCYAVLTASIIYIVLHDLTSYRPHLSDILDVGLRRIFRVAAGGVGLAVAVFVPVAAVAAATSALDLPGVARVIAVVTVGSIIGTRMFVLVPSLAIESIGYFDCVRRSIALTKGHGWRVWGLLLLILCSLWVAGLVFSGVGSAIITALPAAFHGIGGLAMVVAFKAFYWAIWAILPAVTFHYLRLEKEGLDPGAAAAVFD